MILEQMMTLKQIMEKYRSYKLSAVDVSSAQIEKLLDEAIQYINSNGYNNLIDDVIDWGKQRNLTQNKTKEQQMAQYAKTVEEIGELGTAIAKGDTEGIKDGIGDAIVTLILQAELQNMSLHECLRHSYDEIKSRTGKTVDGVFVKD